MTTRMTDLRIPWNECPEAYRHSLEGYVNYGDMPGHFLTAVLEGKLYEAFNRWDGIQPENLSILVKFIWNKLPSGCFGNEESVTAWIKQQQVA